MRYVSWAVYYEGVGDSLYLDVLLPRVIRDLIVREGNSIVDIPDAPSVRLGLKGRKIKEVANEACHSRSAFDLVFIHADAGGRSLEQGVPKRSDSYCSEMNFQCGWPFEQCITIIPRHETEAWLLADGEAVMASLGFQGAPSEVGLPASARDAERVPDPKKVLRDAIEYIAGKRRARRVEALFPAIAQRQRLGSLRMSSSFLDFEDRLRRGLRSLRCLK